MAFYRLKILSRYYNINKMDWLFPKDDSKINKNIQDALKKAKKTGESQPIKGKKNHWMWKNGVEAEKQPNGRYKIVKNHNKDMSKVMADLREKAALARKAKAEGKKNSKEAAAKKVLEACMDDCKKLHKEHVGGDGNHKNFGKQLNTRILEAYVRKVQKMILADHPHADLECPTNIRKARRMANKMVKDDFNKKNSKLISRRTGKERAAIRENDELLTEGDVEGFDDGKRKTVPQFKKKVNKPKRAKKSKK